MPVVVKFGNLTIVRFNKSEVFVAAAVTSNTLNIGDISSHGG